MKKKVLLRQRDVYIKWNVEWGIEAYIDIMSIIVSFNTI